MEGLLILVAAFFGLPVFIGITALIELVVSLVSLLLQLFAEGATHASTPDKKRRIAISPKVLSWIQRTTLALVSVTFFALLLINFVFLGLIVRYAADKAESKTGISVDYESMDGNLFTGIFSFSNVTVIQDKEGSARFNIKAQDVQANLSVLNLLFGNRVIEAALVNNAEIKFEVSQKTSDPNQEEKSMFGFAYRKATEEERTESGLSFEMRRLPRYRVDKLTLSNVKIYVADHSAVDPVHFPVAIQQFEAVPLRSHYLWFDILFRSNIQATLADSELVVENSDSNGLRHTHWGIKKIDAPILASLVGGPFKLFEQGRIDVEVTDQWEIDHRNDIQMDWNLKVKNAQARMPDGTPLLLQPLTKVVINNINASDKDWDFGFQLTLSEDQFEGASSLNAKQIWQDAIPVMLKQASELSGIEADTIKDKTTKAFDAFKGFLKDREEEPQ